MPELPEVERGRRLAASIAEKRTITQVHCADDPIVFEGVTPGAFQRRLQHKQVVAVHRRGKQLCPSINRHAQGCLHMLVAI